MRYLPLKRNLRRPSASSAHLSSLGLKILPPSAPLPWAPGTRHL